MQKYLLAFFVFVSFCANAQKFYLFIGTYSTKGSKGVYVYRFNAATGTVQWVSNTDSSENPSYLAIAPNEKYVYAVNETHGTNSGHISSFAFDKTTGKLSFINQQSTGGDDPCFVSVSKNNKWVAAANYSGGSAAIFAANNDGSLQPYTTLFQDSGRGVVTDRQEKAHVHSAVFSPDYDYLFTPDLGVDKIMIYKFNANSQTPLTPASPAFISVGNGNGPRHFTFHPNKKFAYVIEELSGHVGAYKYSNGGLNLLQHIATHPASYKGKIGSADIHISPDGRFLYASNRGDENTITIFSINAATGKLTLKGYQSTKGKTPRNFVIDPTGNYLLVANQESDNVVIFKRNKQTGMLQETGKEIKISMPVCLQMIK